MDSHLHLRKIAVVLGALALGISAQSYARAAEVVSHSSYVNSAGDVVHCVSTDSGRTYCGRSHTRYVIKEPTSVCVEGSTWGTDERGVWVSGSCSADFSAAADNVTTKRTTTTTTTTRSVPATTTETTRVTESGRVVHCVATESGRTYCGTHHAHYVISGTPDPVCVEGSTWGYDDHGVWVTGGCKGDFTFSDDDDAH